MTGLNILNEVEVCNNDESLRFRCGDLEFVLSLDEVADNEDILKSLEVYFESVGSDARGVANLNESIGVQPLSRRLDGGETAYRLDCALGRYAPNISFSRVLWESYLGREVVDDF